MKKTKKALASLTIAGMLATMVPFNAFASVPDMGTRLAGITAYDTAQKIAQQTESADSVVLAAGMTRNSVDALAAGPLAAQLNAPILLTDGDGTLTPQAKAELQRLMPKKVYVTSGTAVILPAALAEVEAITGAGSVVALGGFDAYATSLNIAKKMVELGAKPTQLFIAGGWATPADALSAASIAAAKGAPILAVSKTGLTADQKAFVATLTAVTNSYVVGGTAVIDAAVEATLPGTVTRLAGLTQYDTNLKVLQNFTDVDYDKVFVANGKTFVDALAGAPLAAKYNAGIVLTDQTVNSALATYVKSQTTDASKVIALGGTAAVPEAARAAIETGTVTPPPLSVSTVTAVNMASSKSVATGQALVDVGTVTVKAGDNGSSITGIKLTRSGLSADTTINSITVWNGTTRLNVPNILSDGAADISFSNPLELAAGESATLAVKVNIAGAALAGAQFAITINELTGASGNLLPATSGTMTVSPVILGTLGVVVSGDAPNGTLDAGTTDQRLAKFDFTANTEAQKLKVLTLTQNNSIGDADLTNLKLYNNGVQVGATASLTNRKVTFDFGDGVDIASGGTVRLELRGDVVGGSGRTVRFDINDATDVQSVGQTFGSTIVGNIVNGVNLAVNPGNFIVSRATTSPVAGTIATVVDDQAFSTIKVEAIGEAIQLQTANINLAIGGGAALTDLRDLKLVCDSKIIAQVATPTFALAGNVEAVTLTSPITVKPGTPAIISITADIPAVAGVVANDTYALGIAAGPGALTGVGTVSGITRNYTAPGNILGNVMTVGAIQVTATRVPKAVTNVFPSDTDTELISFNLSQNLSEDVSVSRLNLAINDNGGGNTNTIAQNFTNMKVFDADGKVISNVVTAPGATTSFDFNTPIVLKPDTTVKVTVKADVLSTAFATDNYDFGLAAGSVARTVALGTNVNVPGVVAGGTVFTINAGGANIAVTRSAAVDLDTNFNVQRGSKDVAVAAYRLTNTGAETGIVESLYLVPTYGGTLGGQHVTNVRIVDASDATKIYATLTDLAAARLIDLTGLEVGTAANNTKDIKVLVDFSETAAFDGTFGVAFGDGGALLDISVQAKTTGLTTNNIAHPAVAQTETANVTETKVNVAAAAVANPVTTAAGAALPGSTIAKFTFTNNGDRAVNIDSVRLTDTLNVLAGKVGTVQLARTSTGVTLSAAAAFANNGDIALTTALRLDPGKSETISLRVVTIGTLAAGDSVAVRLLSAGTVYEGIDTAVGGGFGANADYTVEDNATTDVVSFVTP